MARKKLSRDEFERKQAEHEESLRQFDDYVTRRTAELDAQRRAREEAERRRAERRQRILRFVPFLR